VRIFRFRPFDDLTSENRSPLPNFQLLACLTLELTVPLGLYAAGLGECAPMASRSCPLVTNTRRWVSRSAVPTRARAAVGFIDDACVNRDDGAS
jgi:hypothetical protein